MKKLTLIATFVAFGFTYVNAQTTFGVKANAQISNLYGDDVDDLDSKFGFNVGGYANIRFSEAFAFQPELLFAMQGAKGSEGGMDAKMNLSYITVPLMVKWYFYDGFNAEFGPQIGLNVIDKVKYDGTEDDGTYDFEEVFGDSAETIDFGVNIGAGYEMENGINFSARYGIGLTDVIKDVDGKNSVFSFGIGYTFNK